MSELSASVAALRQQLADETDDPSAEGSGGQGGHRCDPPEEPAAANAAPTPKPSHSDGESGGEDGERRRTMSAASAKPAAATKRGRVARIVDDDSD